MERPIQKFNVNLAIAIASILIIAGSVALLPWRLMTDEMESLVEYIRDHPGVETAISMLLPLCVCCTACMVCECLHRNEVVGGTQSVSSRHHYKKPLYRPGPVATRL